MRFWQCHVLTRSAQGMALQHPSRSAVRMPSDDSSDLSPSQEDFELDMLADFMLFSLENGSKVRGTLGFLVPRDKVMGCDARAMICFFPGRIV